MLRSLLESAGFADVELTQVDKTGGSPSAAEAVTGHPVRFPLRAVVCSGRRAAS